MSERVSLKAAFVWDCPRCGGENFHRGVVAELSPEERGEMGPDADWVAAPEKVTCSRCNAGFDTLFDEDETPTAEDLGRMFGDSPG